MVRHVAATNKVRSRLEVIQNIQRGAEEGSSSWSKRWSLGAHHREWSQSQPISIWCSSCQSSHIRRKHLERSRLQKEHQGHWGRPASDLHRSGVLPLRYEAVSASQECPSILRSLQTGHWLRSRHVIHCRLSANAHWWWIHCLQMLLQHDEHALNVQLLLIRYE